MSQESRWNVAAQHAAVAVAYAVGYLLLRQISWSHWIIFAGYRFSVLLLVPYRFWPALIVGEMGPMAYVSLSCLDTFGWLWSGLMFFPPLAMAMPIVKFCRDHWGIALLREPVRLAPILACTVVVSAVWTFAYVITLSTADVPITSPPIDYAVEGARWFVGNYLGILTVVPLVLLVWQGRPNALAHWPTTLKRALHSSLALEATAFALPALALLVWLSLEASSEASQSIARTVIFVPIVWLALRHGWHGAALGGTMGSIAVALTTPHLYDASTLQAEVFVAFAISSMLLFGGRITVLHQQNRPSDACSPPSLDLARQLQAHYAAQLQQGARGVERVSEALQTIQRLLSNQLSAHSSLNTRELQRRTSATEEQLFQLRDILYPTSLKRQGLRATLRQGGIARALDAQRIGYWCHTQGPIHYLSPALQLALHRIVSEAVNCLYVSHRVQHVSVQIRSGERDALRWVVVRINTKFAGNPVSHMHRPALRLAATGFGIDAVKAQVALFEGKTHVRHRAHGECISALLQEPKTYPSEWVAATEHATRPVLS